MAASPAVLALVREPSTNIRVLRAAISSVSRRRRRVVSQMVSCTVSASTRARTAAAISAYRSRPSVVCATRHARSSRGSAAASSGRSSTYAPARA